jgi:hypothetical protein
MKVLMKTQKTIFLQTVVFKILNVGLCFSNDKAVDCVNNIKCYQDASLHSTY